VGKSGVYRRGPAEAGKGDGKNGGTHARGGGVKGPKFSQPADSVKKKKGGGPASPKGKGQGRSPMLSKNKKKTSLKPEGKKKVCWGLSGEFFFFVGSRGEKKKKEPQRWG